MKSVLFVCTGNTCRSPMAEALLAHKAANRFRVQSAGLFAMNGAKAHPYALKALEKRGVVFQHVTQPVTDALIDWASLILTMTEEHKHLLVDRFPAGADKVFTLKEYVLIEVEGNAQWNALKNQVVCRQEELADYKQRLSNPDLSEAERESLNQNARNAESLYHQRVQQLLKELPDINITDPFGGTERDYDETCSEIERFVGKIVDKT